MKGTLAKEIANGEITEPWPLVDALECEIEEAGLQRQYALAIMDMLDINTSDDYWGNNLADGAVWPVLRATPEQRAQAFLKAAEA